MRKAVQHVSFLTAVFYGCCFGLFRANAGTPADARFQETVFVSDPVNLSWPVRMAWAPDGSGRLFVARYPGKVQIVRNGQVSVTPFVKVDPIYANGECGLLGICFDPNFSANHYVYLFVSVSTTEQQIIRFTDNDGVGSDKTVVVRGLPTLGNQHNGGAVIVGPDGKLFWSIGDNGNRVGVKDNLTSLASKIGRANLDGSVPNDNPFVDGDGPNNDFVWARGFRNPFALAFDPVTGKLWVNVVGNIYEQIFIAEKGSHGGWDEFERTHPEGYLQPVIRYRTNGTDDRSIKPDAGAVRKNGMVTITTTEPHGFLKGERITINDPNLALSSTFHGSFPIDSVLSPTVFTFVQTGADATSGGGKATTLSQGGSVTGGVFYNSTAFPPEFRASYFYGDYNSGRIMRAALNTQREISAIDYFVSGVDQFVDLSVGPDGALYYLGHNKSGTVYRLASTAVSTKAELVVEPQTLNLLEGGSETISVRLTQSPSSTVTVNISRAAGDAALTVAGATSLTFTEQNWSVPQTFTIAATAVSDGIDSAATFSITAQGFNSQSVTAKAIDAAAYTMQISAASIQIREGAEASFTVRLAGAPPGSVQVTANVSGNSGLTIVNGGTLNFDANNFATAQSVVLMASEDANLSDETATVTLSAAGQQDRMVTVAVSDNDPLAPLITSQPVTETIVGASFNYKVLSTGNPAPVISLVSAPSGMSVDTSGTITWRPEGSGNFTVTVKAANGVGADATQEFTIRVLLDNPPTATITKPVDGEVVSGDSAEWFGDGRDDIGTIEAEFYVDGMLSNTDRNSTGHYHFGGEHQRWNTTALANGEHRLKMIVLDTLGQPGAMEITVTVNNQRPVISATIHNDGMVQLQVVGPPAQRYDVHVSGDLKTWARLSEVTADASGIAVVSDSESSQHLTRFYRAVIP
jgi:glucose/arabinose dehydrogenase